MNEAATVFETIRLARAEGVATLTLARPEKRNALNLQMFDELAAAAEFVAADEATAVLVLAADGPSFCAGIDLDLMGSIGAKAETGDGAAGFEETIARLQRPFLLLGELPKPTLAAVRGHALGAGFQLALACDLIVASRDATFGLLEARYGLVPDLGGIHHLVRRAGVARTKELAWTARMFDAAGAERLGVVQLVVPAADLPAEAGALAGRIAAHPVSAALTKTLVDGALANGLPDELARERAAQAKTVVGAEHRRAVEDYPVRAGKPTAS